jgi:tRNA(fMet)-specific endonuclease VapC
VVERKEAGQPTVKYLVDSDWLIDVLIGIPEAVTTLEHLDPSGLVISIVSVGEIYEGAYRSADPSARLGRCREFLAPFPVLSVTDRILSVTDRIMERFAWVRAALRQQDNLIPDLDLLIAVTAIEHDLTLLTRNRRHFERIPGQKLYDPGATG